MDQKQTILLSIGAAVACNCIPCFEHYWLKAKQADICTTELNEAIAIGEKVKNGAAVAIRNTVDVIQRGEVTEEELGKDVPCVCG